MTSTRRTLGALGCLTVAALLAGCTAAVPPAVAPERMAGAQVTAGASGASAADGSGAADPAPPPVTTPVTTDDLLVLGEALTAALTSGDVEQWMAHTDLDAEAAQQQRDWFAGVHAVPMEVREMHPTFLVRTDDGQGRATAQFAFRYQVSGVDPVPVLEEYEFTLTADGTRWLVSEVTGGGGDDWTYPQLWDLGPINVAESARTVVLYAGDPPSGEELRALDTAVGAVLDGLPLPGDPRLLVEYADPAAMAEMLDVDQADWHNQGYVALASPEVERSGHLPDLEEGEFGTPRLIVNRDEHAVETDYYPGARGGSPLTRYGLTYLVMGLRHPDIAALEWVDTGLAWWFESSGDARVRQQALADYALGLGDVSQVTGFPPDNYVLFYGDEEDSSAYQYQAATIMLFLEERYGRDVVLPFAEDLALINLFSTGAQEEMDRVFDEHVGASRDEIEAAWVAWLQEAFPVGADLGETSSPGLAGR